MSYEVNETEYESLIALPVETRYHYFLGKVADWEEIWSLGDEDGWALCADDDNEELIPLWPARAYAAASATGDWSAFEPRAICVYDWLETWTPGLIEERRLVTVFPTPDRKGPVIEPERLAHDLREYLSQYE